MPMESYRLVGGRRSAGGAVATVVVVAVAVAMSATPVSGKIFQRFPFPIVPRPWPSVLYENHPVINVRYPNLPIETQYRRYDNVQPLLFDRNFFENPYHSNTNNYNGYANKALRPKAMTTTTMRTAILTFFDKKPARKTVKSTKPYDDDDDDDKNGEKKPVAVTAAKEKQNSEIIPMNRSITTVPLKPCPENQRMGSDRNCKPSFSDPEDT